MKTDEEINKMIQEHEEFAVLKGRLQALKDVLLFWKENPRFSADKIVAELMKPVMTAMQQFGKRKVKEQEHEKEITTGNSGE